MPFPSSSPARRPFVWKAPTWTSKRAGSRAFAVSVSCLSLPPMPSVWQSSMTGTRPKLFRPPEWSALFREGGDDSGNSDGIRVAGFDADRRRGTIRDQGGCEPERKRRTEPHDGPLYFHSGAVGIGAPGVLVFLRFGGDH